MLKIKPSIHMNSPNEDRVIRIPKDIRRKLGIRWGEFIFVRIGNHSPILMQVYKALDEDVNTDSAKYSWVTVSTFGLLNNKNETEINYKAEEATQPSKYNITLGADPEFMIFDSQIPYKMYAANSIGLSFTDQLGSDNALGEIRPNPGRNHTELVRNMNKLIKMIPDRIGNNKVARAHSSFMQIHAGFHIHLGIPQHFLISSKENVAIIKSIVRLMDYFVSVPSTVGEPDNDRRLSHSHYGYPGDFRLKLHTLEYRTPGAYLLRSPILSNGILAISKLITDDALSKLEVITKGWTDFSDNPHGYLYSFLKKEYKLPVVPVIMNLITSENKNSAVSSTVAIAKTLERLSGYQKVKEDISNFMNAVLGNNIPSPTFIQNWSNYV